MSIPETKMNLPTLEPMVFSGDPMRYRQWIAEFQAIIEPQVNDSMLRLFYLNKYTTGLAREAIDGHLQVSESSSYDKAQSLLKTRFGDPSILAEQYRRSLEFWETLDDDNCSADKLRKFSDFLDLCRMQKEGYLAEPLRYWDNPCFIEASILKKLPRSISSAWRKRWFDEKTTAVNKLYSLLTDCVRDIADQMSQTCYIYPGSPMYTSIQQQIDQTEKCKYCKNSSHKLQRCDKMQYLSVKDQRKFIQLNGLCYRCMGRGHKSSACHSPIKCLICHLKHPTCLHRWKSYNKNIPHNLDTPNGHYEDYRKSAYETRNYEYQNTLSRLAKSLEIADALSGGVLRRS